MNIRIALVALLAIYATADAQPDDTGMVVVPFEDAKFRPVRADLPDGPQIAVLRGDPEAGSSTMLMRIQEGPVPPHTHTSDYHLVVLEGTMKHWGEGETGETARPLGPGSYWFQPGGEVHAERCMTEECLLHIVWPDKWDVQRAGTEGE